VAYQLILVSLVSILAEGLNSLDSVTGAGKDFMLFLFDFLLYVFLFVGAIFCRPSLSVA